MATKISTSAEACHAHRKSFETALSGLHAEFNGLIYVDIIPPERGLELLSGLLVGDVEAAMLLRAISDSAQRIAHAPRKTPTLCICCPRAIRRVTSGTTFGCAIPATAQQPGHLLAFAFCDTCGAGGDLVAKAAQGLRRIWPDLRQIVVTHDAGHA